MNQISKKLWIFFYIYINLRYLFFIIDHCKHIGLCVVQRNSSLYQDNYVNDTSVLSRCILALEEKRRNAGLRCGLYVLWGRNCTKIISFFQEWNNFSIILQFYNTHLTFFLHIISWLQLGIHSLCLTQFCSYFFFVLNWCVYECKMQSF